ncbi:hypothetical protein [Brevibacillus dissolubilis]|uniref:hypothetical protein n=1 Tax=Brevibacillus dissolubilis TaxID=1844116 RepID=UPI0011175194|nr:hypothetical protein [Brevibacillus dissolubilis]
MQVNNQDAAVIEQVLRDAINNSTDYQAIMTYQEVLNRLQGKPDPNPGMQIDASDPGTTGAYDAVGSASAQNQANVSANAQLPLDGFRYDYDDSSNVVEPRH